MDREFNYVFGNTIEREDQKKNKIERSSELIYKYTNKRIQRQNLIPRGGLVSLRKRKNGI